MMLKNRERQEAVCTVDHVKIKILNRESEKLKGIYYREPKDASKD